MKKLSLSLGGSALFFASGCQTPGGEQFVTDPVSKRRLAIEADNEFKVNAATYFAYGHLLERRGDLSAAVEQYTKALAAQANYPQAQNRLGVCYNKLGQHADATRAFRLAVTSSPNDAQALNNLGFSLYLQGALNEAAETLQKALQLDPNFNRARMNYGLVLAKQGHTQEAYNAFSLVGSPADAHYNVAVVQSEAGDTAGAVQSLQMALGTEPQHRLARVQLRELTGGEDIQPEWNPQVLAAIPPVTTPPQARSAPDSPAAAHLPAPATAFGGIPAMTPVTPGSQTIAPTARSAPAAPIYTDNTRASAPADTRPQPTPQRPIASQIPVNQSASLRGATIAQAGQAPRSAGVVGVMTTVPSPQREQATSAAGQAPTGFASQTPGTSNHSRAAAFRTPPNGVAQRGVVDTSAKPSPSSARTPYSAWAWMRYGRPQAAVPVPGDPQPSKVSAQSTDEPPNPAPKPTMAPPPAPASRPARISWQPPSHIQEFAPLGRPALASGNTAKIGATRGQSGPQPMNATSPTGRPATPPPVPDPCEVEEMTELMEDSR